MSKTDVVENLMKRDLYAFLEVSSSATEEMIKVAYRKKALKLHPDKNPGKHEQATEEFKVLQIILEILTNVRLRKDYDLNHYDKAREAEKLRLAKEKEAKRLRQAKERRVAEERAKHEELERLRRMAEQKRLAQEQAQPEARERVKREAECIRLEEARIKAKEDQARIEEMRKRAEEAARIKLEQVRLKEERSRLVLERRQKEDRNVAENRMLQEEIVWQEAQRRAGELINQRLMQEETRAMQARARREAELRQEEKTRLLSEQLVKLEMERLGYPVVLRNLDVTDKSHIEAQLCQSIPDLAGNIVSIVVFFLYPRVSDWALTKEFGHVRVNLASEALQKLLLERGTLWMDKRQYRIESYNPQQSVKCYKCNKTGHKMNDCRNK